jgi:long-subunit fatty acid transport protein
VTFDGTGTGTAVLGSKVNPLDPADFIEPAPTSDPTCPGVGTVTALTTCLQLKVPMTAQFGGRYIFRNGAGKEIADVEVDLRWENWSAASDINITVEGRDHDIGLYLLPQTIRHGFQDVWSVRTGGSYRLPVGDNQLEFRAGGSYDTAAAPISWTRTDLDGMARLTLAGGVAFEFDHYRVDAGFAWVHEGTTEVVDVMGADANTSQPSPIQPTAAADAQKSDPFNAGTYNGGYIVAMVGVTAMW